MHAISRNGDYIVPSIQRAFGISVTRFIACIERFVTGYDMMWGGTVDVYIVD